MDTTITITSKGQTTLPVAFRRKLGLPESGGKLHAHLDEESGELTLTKPLTIKEISDRVSKHIRPGIKPLENVDQYYQTHRRNPSTGNDR